MATEENRGREEKNDGDALAIKTDQEAKRSHVGDFSALGRSRGHPRAPGTPKKARRQCSLGGEHCSQYLQDCHSL